MFLSEEIDVNSEGGKYGTALQTALAGYLQRKKYNDAVKEETLPIIHHLILKGVHIDARVGRIKDGTAFILFRSGCIRDLEERLRNPIQDREDDTVLSNAARFGDTWFVSVLLRRMQTQTSPVVSSELPSSLQHFEESVRWWVVCWNTTPISTLEA
jgi:hypothetical protein